MTERTQNNTISTPKTFGLIGLVSLVITIGVVALIAFSFLYCPMRFAGISIPKEEPEQDSGTN
jgi:hypothetical protein